MAISFTCSLKMSTHFQVRNNCGPSFSPTPKRIAVHAAAAAAADDSMLSGVPQSLKSMSVGSLSTYGFHSSGGSPLKQSAIEIQRPSAKKKKIRNNSVEYNKLDHYQILEYPLFTEAAIRLVADENTLVFKVDKRADKKNIRDAFEKMFNVKTKKINTLISYDNTKKAFITLRPEFDAGTVAQRNKMI